MFTIPSLSRVLTALALFAAVSCGKKPDAGSGQVPLSGVHTEAMAMSNYIEDPERALELIDSAALEGNISAERALFLRGCVYLVDESRQDSLIILLEPSLRSGFLSEEGRENVLSLMLSYYRMKGNLAEQSRIAGELSVYYHRIGNSVKCSRMQIEEGNIKTKLGQAEEGIAQIEKALADLDPVASREGLEAFFLGEQSLIYYYVEEGVADRIIDCAGKMLKAIEDYEANPGRFSEEPSEERAQYIDFRKASAYSFLALGNAKAWKYDEAEKWAAAFESTKNSSILSRRRVITSAYFEMGLYDKVLETLDDFCEAWQDDTLHHNYGESLRMRSVIAKNCGRYEESFAYMERYMNLTSKLMDEKSRAEAGQYAVQYRLREEETARAAVESRLTLRNRVITILIFVILSMVAFLVLLLWQRGEVNSKNKAISRQIAEVLNYKERLEKEKKPTDYMVSRASISKMDAPAMYRFLTGAIRNQRLYLDPSFGRHTLNERFGVSYNQIGKAFSSAGTTFAAFVNDLRLDFACKLLLKDESRSISDVASSSGFTSSLSFGRSFKQKFALTPSEYRQEGLH